MTIDWLTLSWTVPAVVAGSVNLRIWWDTVADYRWAEAADDVRLVRILTARDQVMLHSFLLAVPSVMVTIGLVAMVGSGVVARAVIIGGLIAIPLLLAVAALWTRANWRRILRLLEREAERRAALDPTHIEAAAVQILETAQQVESDAEDIRVKAVEMQEGPEEPS